MEKGISIMFIGPRKSGKTTLITEMAHETALTEYNPTNGIECIVTEKNISGHIIKLNLYTCAEIGDIIKYKDFIKKQNAIGIMFDANIDNSLPEISPYFNAIIDLKVNRNIFLLANNKGSTGINKINKSLRPEYLDAIEERFWEISTIEKNFDKNFLLLLERIVATENFFGKKGINGKAIRTVFIGGSNVGRISIIRRISENYWRSDYFIAYAFYFKGIQFAFRNFLLKVLLWYLDSRDRVADYWHCVCLHSHIAFFLFNLTQVESFRVVERKINEIINLLKDSNKTIHMILVGSKMDLIDERVVTYEEGYTLAMKCNMPYIETSSKENINTEEMLKFALSSYKLS